MRRLTLLLLLLAGCDFESTSPLDIALPDYAPQLVVGAFVSPDGPIEARFAVSAALLAEYDADASRRLGPVLRAAIYDEAGALLDSLRWDASAGGPYPLFRSTVVPRAGQRYEMRASAPGLPPVRAVADVPRVVAVRVAPGSGDANSVRVSWDDPPGPAVYRIGLTFLGDLSDRRADFTSPDLLLRRSYQDLDGAASIETDGLQYFSGEALVRDAAFDGQTYTVPVTALTLYVRPEDRRALRVTLSVLSPDFARYMQALDVQQASAGNPFVQPTDAFTNVEGGLGAFVGWSSASVTVR